LKVEYLNPFIKATIQTYSNMLGEEVGIGKPFAKSRDECKSFIVGSIGLTGELTGAVVLSYDKDSILPTVSAFIGEDITEMCDDISDAVGELVNVVAGAAKQHLVGAFNISLPTVKDGAFESFFPSPGPIICIPMTCKNLPGFDLIIGYKE
jgi:chemotaxis protein CheX